MVFNSLSFLIFFPTVVLVYYLIPCRVRCLWLLFASWFFYMSWNISYGLLLLFSTATAYFGALLLSRAKNSGSGKRILIISLLAEFCPLVFFKYTGFILDSINHVFEVAGSYAPFALPDILLPIGISFYTFQAAGYIIDVYRGTVEAERNFFRFALFVAFFPQLVAGPIERTKNLLSQLDCTARFDFEKARDGLYLMLWGYIMKVVIADRIAIFVNCVYESPLKYGGVYLITAAMLFSIQIYCDFAGYSTIAKGAAKILGINLMDNFNSPTLSISVSEYWRRWHISLTSWFRDYLYISLGGNRKGPKRKLLNKFVVFTISGLWHGADWTYVMWGSLNGIFIILEDIASSALGRIPAFPGSKHLKLPIKLIKWLLTCILVDIAYIFFRAVNMGSAFLIIESILKTSNWKELTNGGIFSCGLDVKNFVFLLIMIAMLMLVDLFNNKGIRLRTLLAGKPLPLRSLLTAAAAVFILLFGIWGSTYDAAEFIYFQF